MFEPYKTEYKTVEVQVKNVVAKQLGVDLEKVTPDASFIDNLGADSLDAVELIMAFEEAFSIEIPDNDGKKILKVQGAIDYIEGKLKN